MTATPQRAGMNLAIINGTYPERMVGLALDRQALRYTRNDHSLPGSPDFVLTDYKVAIFVHGCFFHGHTCKNVRPPKKNRAMYRAKVARNQERDAWCEAVLVIRGWRVITIWECELLKKG